MGGVTTAGINFCNELSRRDNDVYWLDLSLKYLCKDKLNKRVKIGKLTGRSCYWNLSQNDIKKKGFVKKISLVLLGVFKKIAVRAGFWYKIIFKTYTEFGSFDVAIAFRQCAPCYSFVLNKVEAKRKIGFVHGELKGMGKIDSWQKHMKLFSKIAYVSDAVKEGFLYEYPELSCNASTIYNMIDVEYIKQQARADSLTFDRNKVNIVTVSRIENKHKSINRIPTVCRRLKDACVSNFEWYIVGDGPDYEQCVQQAKDLDVLDVLKFCGAKKNPYPYIAQSDFTVLPSKSESFGLVVVESLILGKPVVACEYPALKELIADGVNGLIVGQGEEPLYQAISKLILDERMREQLVANCLNYEYLNDKAYRQFLEAIE